MEKWQIKYNLIEILSKEYSDLKMKKTIQYIEHVSQTQMILRKK